MNSSRKADLFEGVINGVPQMDQQLKADMDKEIATLRTLGEHFKAFQDVVALRISQLQTKWEQYQQVAAEYKNKEY